MRLPGAVHSFFSRTQIVGENFVVDNGNTGSSPQIGKRAGVRVVPVAVEGRQSMPGVSVVIPCLNEKATITEVVREARTAFDGWSGSVEVIVADNGSIDGSPALAAAAGALVVSVAARGYGAALQAGFAAARNPYLVFADADLTYDFREGPALVAAMHNLEAEMAVGTRTRGHIEPGAMPTLHRLVGTPVLTWVINRLFGGSLSDCNSGFRALRKDSFARWGADSVGMEFASELLTNALEAGSKIVEVPITLRCDRVGRQPHLQTWRDGMRHLLIILARAPWLFVNLGFFLALLSALIAIGCLLGPRTLMNRFALFDYHTLILAALMGFFGSQILGTGLTLNLSGKHQTSRLATALVSLNEATLFWVLFGTFVVVVTGVASVFWTWVSHGYEHIGNFTAMVFLLYVATVVGSFGMSLLHVHLMKRAA
jgi:glycosyltransferase involved in cell wall biosynthesis